MMWILPDAFPRPECEVVNLLALTLGGRARDLGDTPKTLGREESLHPLRIPNFEIGDTVKGLLPLCISLAAK
jgi:hypothetical protein